MNVKEQNTVSLVLGSGGARGIAHIGVINWLDEHGFKILSISGASMGALVGGIYAAGALDIYARWVSTLEKMDVVRLLDFSFERKGLIKGDRIMNVLRELIGPHNIEDLPISFTAVATDMNEEREVWLNQGPLFDAIRASIAIPTIFTPVNFRGHQLMDGGLINPIPMAPTLRDKTDITIAVNVCAKAEPEGLLKVTPPKEPPRQRVRKEDRGSYRARISEFLDDLQERFLERDQDEADFIDIISHSFDTMQSTITRFQMAAYSPDIIIEVPRNSASIYEFYRASELIALGYRRAEAVLAPYIKPTPG
ncbi:MAG: patatin-like phospholipase family protein [Pseudomonadota bacterium]